MNITETELARFRAYISSLFKEYGLTVQVKFLVDNYTFEFPVAGIRVLETVPIFDRRTGDVEHWRYLMLFAEMGVLDQVGSGNPVHVFECTVGVFDQGNCELLSTDGRYRFQLSSNDPHSLSERQADLYEQWYEMVERAGGDGVLQSHLDRLAAASLEEHVNARKARE